MNHIGMVAAGLNIEPAVAELSSHPELWDQIRIRTFHPKSPHRDVSDIWLRYNAIANFRNDMGAFNAPHASVWYRSADIMPSVKALALQAQTIAKADLLGGVLITKVPAGKCVYPHVDRGWHAEHFDTKYAVQLRGNRRQAFCYEDGELIAESGDVYWFENTVPHWVRNDSDEDRITLIVTMKRSH